MPEPISHAEMIAWLRSDIREPKDDWCADERRYDAMQRAILLHLERTQPQPMETAPKQSEILAIGRHRFSRWKITSWIDAPHNQWRHFVGEEPAYWCALPPSPETPRE